jgi:hypothetical protein
VAVLAHLGDEDARPAALALGELGAALAHGSGDLRRPRPLSLLYTPLMVRIVASWRPKTFSSARLISPTVARCARGLDRQLEQVALARRPPRW